MRGSKVTIIRDIWTIPLYITVVKMEAAKKRPICYFDILVDGEAKGRIQVQLYNDVVPKTCENFMKLCQGTNELGQTTGKIMTYLGCTVHRIKYNRLIETGDFSHNDGTGGESIFGGTFDDENFDVKHDEKYMVTMVNNGPNTNGSQFAFTKLPEYELDGKNVAFGKVLKGTFIIDTLCKIPVDQNFKPIADIVIARCGIMETEDGELAATSSSHEGGVKVAAAADKKESRRKERSPSIEVIGEVKKQKRRKRRLEASDIPEFNEQPNPLYRSSTGQRPYNELDRQTHNNENINDREQQHDQSRQHRHRNSRPRDYEQQDRHYREDSPSVERPSKKIRGRGVPRYQPYARSSISSPSYWKAETRRIIPMKDAQELIDRKKEETRAIFNEMPDETERRRLFPLYNPEHDEAQKHLLEKRRQEREEALSERERYFGYESAYDALSSSRPSSSSSHSHHSYQERSKPSILGAHPPFYQYDRSYSSSYEERHSNNNNFGASSSDLVYGMRNINILSSSLPPPTPLNEIVTGMRDIYFPSVPSPPRGTPSTSYQQHERQQEQQPHHHPQLSYKQPRHFFF